MRRRFLLHSLSHTFILVDITAVDPPVETSASVHQQTVPIVRFQSLRDAKQYLRTLGAGEDVLEGTFASLKKQGVAVMTIV